MENIRNYITISQKLAQEHELYLYFELIFEVKK